MESKSPDFGGKSGDFGVQAKVLWVVWHENSHCLRLNYGDEHTN